MLTTRLGLPRLRGAGAFLIALIGDALGTGLFLPVSLLYFHVVAGLPLPTVGVALSAATLLTIPLGPLGGALADRFGARRVVVAAELLQGAGFLAYLVVGNVAALVGAALLVTAGLRLFWATFFTFIAEFATVDDRERWYGLAGAAQNAGIGLGGLLSGLLIAASGTAGYRLIVAADGVSFLLAAALLLWRVRAPAQHGGTHPASGGYRTVLADRPFVGATVANVVFALCSLLLVVALPVYATETLHVPLWLVGLLFALNTALLAVAQTLVVRLLEPYRRTRTLVCAGLLWAGWCVLSATAVAVPHALLIAYLVVVTGLYTLGELIHAPISNALAAAASPDALRGRYLAAFQLSWSVAIVIAPSLFTLLYSVQPVLPWLVVAGLAIAASGGIYRLEPHLPREAVRRACPGVPEPTVAEGDYR